MTEANQNIEPSDNPQDFQIKNPFLLSTANSLLNDEIKQHYSNLQQISTKLKDTVSKRLKKHKNMKLTITNGWTKEETNKNLAKMSDLLQEFNSKSSDNSNEEQKKGQKKKQVVKVDTMLNNILHKFQNNISKNSPDTSEINIFKSPMNIYSNEESISDKLNSPHQRNSDNSKGDKFFKIKSNRYDTPTKITILKDGKNDLRKFQFHSSNEKTIERKSVQNSTGSNTEFEYDVASPCTSKYFEMKIEDNKSDCKDNQRKNSIYLNIRDGNICDQNGFNQIKKEEFIEEDETQEINNFTNFLVRI